MRDRNSGGAVEQTADALYKVVNRTRFETVLHGLGGLAVSPGIIYLATLNSYIEPTKTGKACRLYLYIRLQ